MVWQQSALVYKYFQQKFYGNWNDIYIFIWITGVCGRNPPLWREHSDSTVRVLVKVGLCNALEWKLEHQRQWVRRQVDNISTVTSSF